MKKVKFAALVVAAMVFGGMVGAGVGFVVFAAVATVFGVPL